MFNELNKKEEDNRQLENVTGGSLSTYESGANSLYHKGQQVYYHEWKCTVTQVSSEKSSVIWQEYTYSIRLDKYMTFIDLGNNSEIPDSEKETRNNVWEHDLRLEL